jgi:hypothetical protein
MATLRNLSTGIFKMAGHTSIATACRHHARDATRTLATLALSPPMTKTDITALCRAPGGSPRLPCRLPRLAISRISFRICRPVIAGVTPGQRIR